MSNLIVLGAGGHAKVLISTVQAAGHKVEAVYDDDPLKWGRTLLGVTVRGPIAKVKTEAIGKAIVAVGNNRVRQELVDKFATLEWASVVHPTAYVHQSVTLGPGTVVFAGAIIQPESRLGNHVIVNTGATVDHDCTLGDFVHLAPGVHLAGGVQIERGALLGIGAVVIPNRRIGSWTVVGAGAAVVRDLSDHVTAVGVPAEVHK